MDTRDAQPASPPKNPVVVAPSDIFLSPRIVDHAAFEGYAARLKEIVEDAGRSIRALGAAAAESRRMQSDLAQTHTKSAEQAQTGLKLLRAMEQRVSELTALGETVAARIADAASIEERLTLLTRESSARLEAGSIEAEQRIARAIDAFDHALEERLAASERRLAALVERSDFTRDALAKQVESSVLTSEKLLRAQCERAETLLGKAPAPGAPASGLAGLTAAAEQAVQRAASTLAGLRQSQRAAHDGLDKLKASLDGAIAFTDALAAQRQAMDADAAQSLAKLRAARHELAALGKAQGDVKALATALADASQRAKAATDAAQTRAAELNRAVDLAAEAIDMLEPWKSVVLDRAAQGELPDAVRGVIAEMKSELAGDLAKVAQAIQSIAHTASSVSPRSRPSH